LLSIYIAFAAFYSVLYLTGYSIKFLLLNEDLKKFDLYITPWLGLGLIIAVFYPLSWMGCSVSSAAGGFAVAVIIMDAAVRLKFKEPVRAEWRDIFVIALIGLLVSTVYGIPIFFHENEIFAVSQSADFSTYLNVTKTALTSSVKSYRASSPAADASHRGNKPVARYSAPGMCFRHGFFRGHFKDRYSAFILRA